MKLVYALERLPAAILIELEHIIAAGSRSYGICRLNLIDKKQMMPRNNYSAQKKRICSMETITVKVSNRGYIVLPAPLRKALEIKPGAQMLLSRENDRLILTPVHSFTEKLAGLTSQATGRTPQDVDAFIDSQREDRQR